MDWQTERRGVQASHDWYSAVGSRYSAGRGTGGCAHLSHYTVEYREWGEGPPLVLVPGLAGGFELLGPLVKMLAKSFRVISYQLRGEDNCFTLRRPFGMSDLVDDLAELLDSLCLEKPSVFGVSFGGVLALEFAAKYQYKLDRLVIQGAGGRFERGLLQQVASTVLNRFPLPADNPFVNQFFNLLFGGRTKDTALFEFVTRQCWQTDQSVMAHRFDLVQSLDMGRKFKNIVAPTLILAGERDLLVSPRSLMELCDGIRDSQLVRLSNCGHLAFVQKPHQVASLVRDFLQPAAA
jgi:pimeloyl-ACP methyl ester carboxylesterase